MCYKLTPDAGDIEVKSDGSISLERAEWGIGSFDLQAIEAAVRLAEATGGKVIALSAGPHQINQSKLKKDLLSRGPDELLPGRGRCAGERGHIHDIRRAGPGDRQDRVRSTWCCAARARRTCTSSRWACSSARGWACPTLNAISKIEPEGEKLVVDRSLEDEVEVLEVPLPAVLSVTVDINPPRLPTMKEILKAGKKPVTEWSLADLGSDGGMKPQVEVLDTRAPHQVQRKQVVIPGTPEEAARALVGYLTKEGLA